MPTEKFYYSRWSAWYPFGNTAVFGWLIYYNHVHFPRFHKGIATWEIVFIAFVVLFLIWHLIRYLLPMLQKKPYLEIDAGKINFRHRHKIIYEGEIEGVRVGFWGNSLILKLKDKKKLRIYLNCMRGDNGDIAKAIVTFGKAENGEELSRYII